MIDQIKSYISKKCDDFEIYMIKHNDTELKIDNDQVSFVSFGENIGLSIRVLINKKQGFAYTTDIDKFKQCINAAIKIAKVQTKQSEITSFAPKKEIKFKQTFSNDLEKMQPAYMQDQIHDFLSDIKNINKDIKIPFGSFSKNSSEKIIINSNDINLKEKYNNNVFDCELTIKNNGNYETTSFEDGDRLPLKLNQGKKVAKKLLSLINKKSIKSGNYELILDEISLSQLFKKCYDFSIDGENALLKKSIFHNKLNKKVFDEKLTITDDQTNNKLFLLRSFDSEGQPTKKIKFIEKGILKDFMYDYSTAIKAKKISTGHAFRNISTLPHINPGNTIIQKGKSDPVSEVKNGIYIGKLMGIHTIDETTGNFSLGIDEGYFIKNGKIIHPLKNTMIAGNFYELMKNVDCVGKEMNHTINYPEAFYSPKIKFSKIRVIGHQ